MTNEELSVKIIETEDRSKSNLRRIEKMEKKQEELDKIVTAVALVSEEQKRIKDDVAEIKSGVKALAEKPAKRLDGIIDKVLYAIVGAFVAWLINGAA